MRQLTAPRAAASLLLALALCTSCGGNLENTASSGAEGGGVEAGTVQDTTVSAAADAAFSARDLDASYDASTAVSIRLEGDAAEISGNGASLENGVLTIGREGCYLLSGSLEGQILVDAGDADKLQLVLNGVSVENGAGPALWIKNADKVFLTLAEGTENTLADGTEYSLPESDGSVDGAVFSKADLTVNGAGALSVTGNYKHGIVSKDDLIITGGTLHINAAGQAMNGKDCVKIKDGSFTLKSGGDAVQSDNTEESSRGSIYIAGGSFDIQAGTDGFQAETVLQIDGGSFAVVTGGGSANASTASNGQIRGEWGRWEQQSGGAAEETASASAKALKAGTLLTVSGGTFELDSSDDALHSNGNLTVAGGGFTISSGDDGVHADGTVTLEAGTMVISKSYEGIEGTSIAMNGGSFQVTAQDDGLNAAGGADGSSLNGRPGQNAFASDESAFIRITGGTLTVDAGGDGLDSNGALYLEGGEISISGPTDGANGALDYNGEGIVSGGTLIAVGSSGMTQGFSDSSTQCSLLWNLSASAAAGATLSLTDEGGDIIVRFTPEKEYQSIVITSPQLEQGKTYTLSAGTETSEITLDSVSTSNAPSGRGMPGRGGGTRDPQTGREPGTEPGTLPEGMTPPDGGADERPNGGNGFKGRRGTVSGTEEPSPET